MGDSRQHTREMAVHRRCFRQQVQVAHETIFQRKQRIRPALGARRLLEREQSIQSNRVLPGSSQGRWKAKSSRVDGGKRDRRRGAICTTRETSQK
jgi:hypothetical protein